MSTFSEEAKRIVFLLPELNERMVAAMSALPFPGVRCSMPSTTPMSPSYLMHWPLFSLVATIAIGLDVVFWVPGPGGRGAGGLTGQAAEGTQKVREFGGFQGD